MNHEDHVFEVQDWRGRPVRMTRRTFDRHTPKHPEISQYLSEVQEAIKDPDAVYEADNGAVSIVRFGLGHGRYANLYLTAIVFYRRGTGTVATFFFTRSLPNDIPIVDLRHQWLGGQRRPVRKGTENDHGPA